MGKITSKKLVGKIKFLRTQGYSLPEISRETGVPKTTVFRYIQDVPIFPEYLATLKAKRGGSRNRKEIKEKAAFEEAKKVLGILTEKDILLFLSALYWGEGAKKDFQLSNTDPELIKVFVNGLNQVLKIDKERLSVSIRIYEDLDREKCLNFWSKVVGIPRERFGAVDVLNGKKKGKLSFGMCRVRVRKGGDLLKKIVGINKMVAQSMPL